MSRYASPVLRLPYSRSELLQEQIGYATAQELRLGRRCRKSNRLYYYFRLTDIPPCSMVFRRGLERDACCKELQRDIICPSGDKTEFNHKLHSLEPQKAQQSPLPCEPLQIHGSSRTATTTVLA